MILRIPNLRTTLLAVCGICIAGVSHAQTAPLPAVDRPIWGLSQEADRRAVLSYTETAGGPELLSFDCRRAEERFVVTIDGFVGLRPHFTDVRVSLTVEGVAFVRSGVVSTDPVSGRRVVKVDLPADEVARRKIAADLLPVLTASGHGALIVADVRPHDVLFGANERRANGASLLDTFSRVCFGAPSAATPPTGTTKKRRP